MIEYRRGLKYQLARNYVTVVSKHLVRKYNIKNGDFITLDTEGVLAIRAGYAWDGPSGPTIDTRNFMEASLVHDVLYELMRKVHIPFGKSERIAADMELIRIAKAEGMSWLRRKWVYLALRAFAASSADPDNKREVIKT